MFLDNIPQRIDAQFLSEVIPHSGPMVLLDWIEEWDENHILCTTHSHCKKDNPMRIDNTLSAVHTIEYAAQAASFHSALISIKHRKPLNGLDKFGAISTAFLAVVREFHFTDVPIDDCDDVFVVHAFEPTHGPRLLQYRVRTEIKNQTISHGVITLVVEG